jgi:capsular exopolysaccharide synthesis family protein
MVPLTQAAPASLVLPRKNLNLVIGLLLGVLLGFGYALVRHQFDRRLRSSGAVEREFGIPVIGMIPRSSHVRHSDGRELALAVTGSPSASTASTAEGFRKLRTNLAYVDVDQPPRVIVVTSPKPSDGKSTVAANLAAAIAIGGQAVTLIDCDLRRPTVADSLAIVDGAGLTDVLVGRVTPAEVMQDHPDVPGLRVLASGAIPPNPSELLGSKAMHSLITDLARAAMVIIDAPPLLPVTDAAVLTRSADGAIVVITHAGTLDSELAASLSHIAAVHGRTLGIVFNRMRRGASSGFYGGDHHRYEYAPDTRRRGKRKPGRQRSRGADEGRAPKPANQGGHEPEPSTAAH